ncbi:molecular chaperone [Bordetella avium]|nr:molecular chaperone [Bordetella avium]RIQ19335.1 molecular chaperone [Bordetella avium]RIQ33503.1 molecular chaperone [Bordetella avium]
MLSLLQFGLIPPDAVMMKRNSLVLAAALLVSASASASIQLGSTRVILNESSRNAVVGAKNVGTDPVVVQAWIDADGEKMETPFFITPPLGRFDGGVERNLSITRVADGLPKDRESQYWINVLEIPQQGAANTNSLTLATRTRIKLFYRPTAIKDLPRGKDMLAWSWSQEGKACNLHIANSSAYTVNFSRIHVPTEKEGYGLGVIAQPLTTTRVPLSKCPASSAFKVGAQVVNDFGAVDDWSGITVEQGGSMKAAPASKP